MRRSGKGLWQDGLLADGEYESHVSEHDLRFNPERTESVEAPVSDFMVHVPENQLTSLSQKYECVSKRAYA